MLLGIDKLVVWLYRLAFGYPKGHNKVFQVSFNVKNGDALVKTMEKYWNKGLAGTEYVTPHRVFDELINDGDCCIIHLDGVAAERLKTLCNKNKTGFSVHIADQTEDYLRIKNRELHVKMLREKEAQAIKDMEGAEVIRDIQSEISDVSNHRVAPMYQVFTIEQLLRHQNN